MLNTSALLKNAAQTATLVSLLEGATDKVTSNGIRLSDVTYCPKT